MFLFSGHMANDCFHVPGGKTYDLVPDNDDDDDDEAAEAKESSVPRDKKKEKKKVRTVVLF